VPAASVFTWSAETLPEGERIAAWSELVGAVFMPVRVEHDGPTPFWIRATLTQLGRLTLAELSGCGHRLTRLGRRLDRARAESGADTVLINFQMTGTSSARGPGDAVQLSGGLVGILIGDWPECVELPDDFHQVMLTVPTDLLAGTVADLHALIGKVVPTTAAAGALLNRIMYLVHHADELNAVEVRLVAEQLVELLALALGTSADRACSHTDLLVQQIHEEIERRFTQPRLRPADVAQAVNISVRYLQALLAAQGTTFGAIVNDRRLQRCRSAFDADPERSMSTAQIALESGFASPSHFSRVFSRRAGLSARQYRAQISATRLMTR
jgi:AraC-like DNA-binding protein